jgi:hypothetical protein
MQNHHCVSSVSLQVGPRAAKLAALPPGTITDLAPELTDFAETAGAIMNLDLVIAVDTAVAHLAGALGKPAWIMLCILARLALDARARRQSLVSDPAAIRQPAPGDWDDVFARVTAHLAARTTASVDMRHGDRGGSE